MHMNISLKRFFFYSLVYCCMYIKAHELVEFDFIFLLMCGVYNILFLHCDVVCVISNEIRNAVTCKQI